MRQPESTQVSSLYFRTIYAKPGIKPSRVVSVLVPPPPAFRAPLSASVGDLGRVTWAGDLASKYHRGFSPPALGSVPGI